MASFAELRPTLDGAVGFAAVAVGKPGTVYTLGDWSTGPAWSTAKVPLVMAAMRADPAAPATAEMVAAITQSDNAAAESIWDSLGEPATAADRIEAVLRNAGDPTTVQSQRVRPEFTAFGQTIWSLDHQAEFLARAACDPRSAGVLDLMGRISGSQRWGLGTIPGTRFKGGWGPNPEGDYLVRQFGLVPTDHGIIAVAIAAAPTSGSFGSGVDVLDTMAGWVSAHSAEIPAGQCT